MILSIVVPVYNVAKYLPKCLDSLLNQDIGLDDYEIIVVNDGSTDASCEIAQDYAGRFSNIVLLNQENKGLSAARNSGIGSAKGKYIQFVDSDDYLQPNVLKSLVEKMEKDSLDILRFNYQNVNEKYEVFNPNKINKPFVDYRDEVCDGLTFLNERLGYACYAVQFIIKAELLMPHENRFREGMLFEDTEWTPRILTLAHRMTSVETIVYNYLQREGSITQSVDKTKKEKSIKDRLMLLDLLQSQMQNLQDRRWHKGMVAQTVVSLIGNISRDFYDDRKLYINDLKSKKVFPLSTYQASRTARKRIRMANISPALLCFLLHVR